MSTLPRRVRSTSMLSEMCGGVIGEHCDSAVEMLLCVQVRLHTTRVFLFPVAALSLLAVRNGLGKTFWTILSSMRMVYSYSFSHDLAIELGERIRAESVVGGMSSITFAAADNKGCYIKTNEEHSEEGCRNEFLQTVNWLTSIIPLSHGIAEITGRLSAWTLFVSLAILSVLVLFSTHVEIISSDLLTFDTGSFRYVRTSNEDAYAHLMDSKLRVVNHNLARGYFASISAEGIRVDERRNY